jgi:hypothetical protein
MRGGEPGITRRIDRVLLIGLGMASVGLAALCVRVLLIGVRPHDHWLFLMLFVLPAMFALVSGFTLLLSSHARAQVALLGVAGLVALYLVETALAVLETLPRPAGVHASNTGSGDTRTRVEVIRSFRAQGIQAYPAMGAIAMRLTRAQDGPGISMEDQPVAPLAHLANRLVVDCNESGTWSMFQTDERGFNNPPGLWRQPLDVAAVGDSFVQGSCVQPTETLVAIIRREQHLTLGLGIGGAGPLSMLGMIKEYLPDVKPRHVVWFYYEGNDLRNLMEESGADPLRGYLETGTTQRLVFHQAPINAALAEFIDTRLLDRSPDLPPKASERSLRSRARQWSRLHRLRTALALADVRNRLETCQQTGRFIDVLQEARTMAESWGGQLHFVYLPAVGRYFFPISALLDDSLRCRGRILDAVQAAGVPILDVHRVFSRTDNTRALFYHQSSHFNPAGYALTGHAVVRHLDGSRP